MLLPMLDWSQCPEVERVPGKVGGVWLFKDSRVPVKALFENIESSSTVQEFLEWFPEVTRGGIRCRCSRFPAQPRSGVRLIRDVEEVLDQGTPVPLRQCLPGHEVITAFEMGSQTLRGTGICCERPKQKS